MDSLPNLVVHCQREHDLHNLTVQPAGLEMPFLDRLERRLREDVTHNALITSAVESCSWWSLFHEPRELDLGNDDWLDDWDDEPVETIRYESPKPGRNAPCPCGSGRKYKNCCGR